MTGAPDNEIYDVVVAGAGPAGIAAALRAHECGLRVVVIDDNQRAGGQIWRGGKRVNGAQAARWFARFDAAGIHLVTSAQIISVASSPPQLILETPEKTFAMQYRSVILATGAREIFLPFPGWTLPGVMGVGGLQALAKSGLPVNGKRIVIAGSGPLLLAVAAHLRQKGAHIALIAEQAKRLNVAKFAFQLLRHPRKAGEAIALQSSLAGLPLRYGAWVEAAEGSAQIQGARIRQGKKTWLEPCDYLAVGFGLTPSTEVAELLGCKLNGTAVACDEWQRSSVPNVFCAGEITGIGGVDFALVEGEIAGYAAAAQLDRARSLFGRRRAAQRFAAALNHTFALREELKYLAQPDTVLCRCEDVTLEQLAGSSSFRGAKLHTRCGMGPCQGRVCGPALAFLFGWKADSVRPPLFPARLSSLAEHKIQPWKASP